MTTSSRLIAALATVSVLTLATPGFAQSSGGGSSSGGASSSGGSSSSSVGSGSMGSGSMGSGSIGSSSSSGPGSFSTAPATGASPSVGPAAPGAAILPNPNQSGSLAAPGAAGAPAGSTAANPRSRRTRSQAPTRPRTSRSSIPPPIRRPPPARLLRQMPTPPREPPLPPIPVHRSALAASTGRRPKRRPVEAINAARTCWRTRTISPPTSSQPASSRPAPPGKPPALRKRSGSCQRAASGRGSPPLTSRRRFRRPKSRATRRRSGASAQTADLECPGPQARRGPALLSPINLFTDGRLDIHTHQCIRDGMYRLMHQSLAYAI